MPLVAAESRANFYSLIWRHGYNREIAIHRFFVHATGLPVNFKVASKFAVLRGWLLRKNIHGGSRRVVGAFHAALLMCFLGVNPAQALIVGSVPGVVPATTVNPNTYYGSSAADPGWDNMSALGSNYVYLGDGWVLSARHVGYNESSGVSLQTYLPDGSPGPIKSFYRIPGTYYHDYGYTAGGIRQYAISNPMTLQSETGQTISLAASNGTYFSDTQLFRISEDPGLPALTLASQPMPSDFTRATAPEVVTIGLGIGRQAAETHWNVSGSTWTETTGTGSRQGYKRTGSRVKHFGTNRITDFRPNTLGDPSDPGAINYTVSPNNWFSANDVISDSTAAIGVLMGGGVTFKIISMMTVFDRQSAIGSTALETQATSGNSGSGVFYNRGTVESPQWELAGLVHATWTYDGQPSTAAVYGNGTIISDLWYYNQDYPNSIRNIIDSHANYSYIGDVNLDGNVFGDGTGVWESDDVAAFIAGWGYDNGTGVGTLTSWRNGDFSRDGKTDITDFLLLRNALNGQISQSFVTALFGEGGLPNFAVGVPEPSVIVLMLPFVAMLMAGTRRRS